jgi:hypothetical protein
MSLPATHHSPSAITTQIDISDAAGQSISLDTLRPTILLAVLGLLVLQVAADGRQLLHAGYLS